MYKGAKSLKALFFAVMICTLILSCATLSPFVDKNDAFSFLGASIPKNGTLTFFVKTDFLKERDDFKNDPLLSRCDFITVAYDNRGEIYGGVEGRFIADLIRFATGENRVEQNGLTFIQSDSGLFVFSNNNIEKAKETLIDNRKIFRSKEEMKQIFNADISIRGENVEKNVISSVFNADVPLKNINLSFSKKYDNAMSLGGVVECYSKEDVERLSASFKLWIIALYRREGRGEEIKNLQSSLSVEDSKMVLNNVYFPLSGTTQMLNIFNAI